MSTHDYWPVMENIYWRNNKQCKSYVHVWFTNCSNQYGILQEWKVYTILAFQIFGKKAMFSTMPIPRRQHYKPKLSSQISQHICLDHIYFHHVIGVWVNVEPENVIMVGVLSVSSINCPRDAIVFLNCLYVISREAWTKLSHHVGKKKMPWFSWL